MVWWAQNGQIQVQEDTKKSRKKRHTFRKSISRRGTSFLCAIRWTHFLPVLSSLLIYIKLTKQEFQSLDGIKISGVINLSNRLEIEQRSLRGKGEARCQWMGVTLLCLICTEAIEHNWNSFRKHFQRLDTEKKGKQQLQSCEFVSTKLSDKSMSLNTQTTRGYLYHLNCDNSRA